MNNVRKYLNIASIVSLSIFALLSVSLSWLSPVMGESASILFVALYGCAVLPLAWLSSSWLIWVGRHQIAKTIVWGVFQLLFFVSMTLYTSSILGSLFSSLLILLFPLLGLINFLYAFKNGFSARLIAVGSVGFMWSILIAWTVTGNLLNAWIETMVATTNNILWLNALLYGFACATFAGIVAFCAELVSVLSRELAAK